MPAPSSPQPGRLLMLTKLLWTKLLLPPGRLTMLLPPPMIGRLPPPGRFPPPMTGRSAMPGRLPMPGRSDAGRSPMPGARQCRAARRRCLAVRQLPAAHRCRGEWRRRAARPTGGSHFQDWAGSPVRAIRSLSHGRAGDGSSGRRRRIAYSHRRPRRGRGGRASGRPAHLRKRRPGGASPVATPAATRGRGAGRDPLGPIDGLGEEGRAATTAAARPPGPDPESTLPGQEQRRLEPRADSALLCCISFLLLGSDFAGLVRFTSPAPAACGRSSPRNPAPPSCRESGRSPS